MVVALDAAMLLKDLVVEVVMEVVVATVEAVAVMAVAVMAAVAMAAVAMALVTRLEGTYLIFQQMGFLSVMSMLRCTAGLYILSMFFNFEDNSLRFRIVSAVA